MIYQNRNIFKNLLESNMEKNHLKIKFVKYITFLWFKWFLQKIIFSLLNDPFNNNIAILESKIIYFCLRPNFRGRTTLITAEIRIEVFHGDSSEQRKIK